ncbi:MFS transporter [Methylobacterium brachythecii]|uniref:DHA2 family multidrug resistance protein-like MFS transporter n=1 Tax=Methylobacterium brachythecii TaxID=1176177 RepID=A0A7W6AF71_9HYPH|nr:MFS transporter [Methylobacterium brachythecii]MBB3901121.1 DHA2 family multidrug resistance protein-like MFS transporter [Methylobacterium brachythecii]GLS45233.1 multidrug MFS transporter [Methylobacterium brachythecii]
MTDTPPDGLPIRERLLALLAIALAMTLAVLDGAIVNVALPAMAKDLAVRPDQAIFLVNGYQIAVTAALLPLAALGDGIGYRKVYLAGLSVFTVASAACAYAPNLDLLIVARIAQGLGAAGIMSVNIALVRFIYPARLIGRGVGNIALIVAVASAAGPTVAAAILSVATWHWLFLVNLPVGLAALLVGARTLPYTPTSGRRLDIPSSVLNALTFGLVIIGVDGLGSAESRPLALAELGAALVIGTVFVRRQLALPAPLLPVDLLRIPAFALSMASSICAFSAQMTAFVALPFYLQDVLHLSATQTGLLMTPWPIAVAAIAPFAGRLSDRYPPGLLGGIGLATMAAGLTGVVLLPADPSPLDIAWRLSLTGLGFGLFQSPNNRLIITSAPPERSGGASGMQSTARLTGQSLGAALVAVLFGITHADGAGGNPAHAVLFSLSAAIVLALTGTLTSVLRKPLPAKS